MGDAGEHDPRGMVPDDTDNGPAESNADAAADRDPREIVLEHLERAVDDLAAAVTAAEPETPDEQKLQLRRYHELGYLANQYRKLRRDSALVEMDQRLQLLERAEERER